MPREPLLPDRASAPSVFTSGTCGFGQCSSSSRPRLGADRTRLSWPNAPDRGARNARARSCGEDLIALDAPRRSPSPTSRSLSYICACRCAVAEPQRLLDQRAQASPAQFQCSPRRSESAHSFDKHIVIPDRPIMAAETAVPQIAFSKRKSCGDLSEVGPGAGRKRVKARTRRAPVPWQAQRKRFPANGDHGEQRPRRPRAHACPAPSSGWFRRHAERAANSICVSCARRRSHARGQRARFARRCVGHVGEVEGLACAGSGIVGASGNSCPSAVRRSVRPLSAQALHVDS